MKTKLFFLTLAVVLASFSATTMTKSAQSSVAVINASGQYTVGQGLAPCTQASLYGTLSNTVATVATDTNTNLLGGYRVRVVASPTLAYWASLSYVGTVSNGQVNFVIPCDKSLVNHNVTVELHKVQPNSSTIVAGTAQVSLEEFVPGLFMQAGSVPAGTYFQRTRGVEFYLPMVTNLPDGQPGAAEFLLSTATDTAQAIVLYTTGGKYLPNGGYTPTVRIGGKDGLATVNYFGPSTFADSVEQLNAVLSAQTIIDSGFAFGQFLKIEVLVNGRVIGTGLVRFKKA